MARDAREARSAARTGAPARAPAWLLLALALATGCAPRPARPPDVVLIVMDTTRADRLGVYGNPRPVSPRVDAFARDGVLYSRAWSTASWTLPAHASLLTGLLPDAHGAIMKPGRDADSLGDNPPYLPQAAVTLAELLAEAGYRTGAFAGAGWLDPQFGLLQGYEVQDAKNFRRIGADHITDRAVAWLRALPSDAPAHLLVNYFDPHDPYDPPPGFDRFPGARGPMPEAKLDEAGGYGYEPEQKAAVLARYDGEILFMDHHLGRLLDALRALHRYRDALIVVTADHGELFGEHGALGHGAWLWEEVLRVPLIVHFPGGRDAGSVRDDPTSLVDVLPMIASEVGLALSAAPTAAGPRGGLVLASERPSPLFRKLGIPDAELRAGIRWPWKLIVTAGDGAALYRVDAGRRDRGPLHDAGVEAALRAAMDASEADLRALPPDPEPHAMSPEARERLRALGYLE